MSVCGSRVIMVCNVPSSLTPMASSRAQKCFIPTLNSTQRMAKRTFCPHHGIDRKSVVWGKSVSVRVDLGGLRIIKKKNRPTSSNPSTTCLDTRQHLQPNRLSQYFYTYSHITTISPYLHTFLS